MIIYGERCTECNKELILSGNGNVQAFEIMARSLEPSRIYDGKCCRGLMFSYVLCRNCFDKFNEALKRISEEEKYD